VSETAASVAQATLSVSVRGVDFEFRIPKGREMGRVGIRAAMLRRQDSPGDVGWEDGLDNWTAEYYRGCALMEILLAKSSAAWAYTETNGDIVVDSSKFPPESMAVVGEVNRAFLVALDKFLGPGDRNGKPSGAEGVSGGGDSA